MSDINDNEYTSFNDLSTRDLKRILDTLKTTKSFEEFVMQLDLLGIDDLKKQEIFQSLSLEGQYKIQTVLSTRSYNRKHLDSSAVSISPNIVSNASSWANAYSITSNVE